MNLAKNVFLVLAILLAGCSTPESASKKSEALPESQGEGETTRTWQIGHYQVRFAAGPIKHLTEGGQRSFSTYAVLYQEEGQIAIPEVAGSAMNIDMLIDSPSLSLSDYIGVWASPSERWLLIKEDVPNDCAPCANFVMFERLEEEFKVFYLRMPTWQPSVKPLKGGMMPPVFAEDPTILKVTENEIEYHFSDKKRQRIKIRDVPRAEGVTFPG
jgi:hypothetical protein